MPKQYLKLRGRTMLEWSAAALLALDWIEGVVVVLSRKDRRFPRLGLARHPRIITAVGGAARADSVLAGLKVVAQRCAVQRMVRVLVHDAARPCVQKSDIERLRDEANDRHGGLLAQPAVDTLKTAQQGRVAATLDRSSIWRAQTPQLFRLDLLMKALSHSASEVTDEASAMERAGYRPRLVPGAESNIKVTYPEDLKLAEFWLGQGRAA